MRHDDDIERVRVHRCTTPFEAHFYRTILVAEGIDAVVKREALAGLGGVLPLDHCLVEVWVPVADEARAAALLDARAPPGAELRCRECGELSPPGFEICWQCDRVLVG